MTKNVLKTGLLTVIIIGTFSCKNKENDLADQRIEALETYVDSLKTVSAEDMEKNWDKIAIDYDLKNADANEALSDADKKTKLSSQERMDASTAKYYEFKARVETGATEKAMATQATKNPSQLLRDRLFGAGKIGNDMSFAWVNKSNILNVYDKFFAAYKENKESFSREDYDEIKLMYEALDSRKNTVENEGLSSEDNRKIASIKFKFNPMFQLNRAGAKTREASKAKE